MAWLLAALLSASLQDAPEGVVESDARLDAALQDLSAAWLEGDFDLIARRADAALAIIESSDCPMRSDAAVAAAMGAIAGWSEGVEYTPGYLHWVASTVNTRLDVLPEPVWELSELEKSEPGERRREDALFARSPYRHVGLDRRCAEPVLDPELLLAEPRQPTEVFVALRWRSADDRRRWRDSRLVYAFPASEGAAISAQIIALRDQGGRLEASTVRRFDPCSRFIVDRYAYVEVCRDPAPEL